MIIRILFILANAHLILIGKSFGQIEKYSNVNISSDTLCIKYPSKDNIYISFEKFAKSNKMYVYEQNAKSAKDSISLSIPSNKIIIKEVHYNVSSEFPKYIFLYKFYGAKILRKFIRFYDNSFHVQNTSVMFNNEKVGDEIEYYETGSIKSIGFHEKNDFGKNRSRKKYKVFIEDDFLNGMSLTEDVKRVGSMEIETLNTEYYRNGAVKKEVKYDKSFHQFCLYRYNEDGSIKVKAALKYGSMDKGNIQKYFMMQSSNSLLIEMSCQHLDNMWYFDGYYIEYGLNGYETKKIFKEGLALKE